MMQDYQSNRPIRQQPPGRFPNESDRTVERIRKRKKKQTQRRMVLCGAISALAVIIVGIILLAKGCSGGTDALAGTWEFDGTTTYSFDGSGSGAMELPSISYDFTYTIDGNKLMIDYANESVRDSEIQFSIFNNRKKLFLKNPGRYHTDVGPYFYSVLSDQLIQRISSYLDDLKNADYCSHYDAESLQTFYDKYSSLVHRMIDLSAFKK